MKSTRPDVEPNGTGPAAATTTAEPPPSSVPLSLRRHGPGPNTRPALIVLGVALVLFVAGAVAGGLASQGSGPANPTSVTTARGAGLEAVAARPALGPVIQSGQPPDDLVAALALPRGATAVAGSATDRGVGLYDRSLRLQVGASEQAVITFFRAQLPAEKWHLVSQGVVPGGSDYRVIAEHPASDGRNWELGVTVSPTAFAPSGASPTGTTPFTMRLYALPDQI